MKHLPKLLAQDRIKRLLKWSEYAVYLGIPLSTLYAAHAGKPMSALTRAKIAAKLDAARL